MNESEFIRLAVDDRGDLVMTLLLTDPEDKSDLREQYHEFGEVDTLSRLLEPFAVNGSFSFVDGEAGNPHVGLTSAPCVAESLSYDDDGQATVEGRLWWFPNYAIEGVVDTLLDRGEVTWTAAPTNTPSPRKGRTP